jgi:hypothetical protein
MMQDRDHKQEIYDLISLVREQNDVIQRLRLMFGALTWLVTHGDEEKIRQLHAVMWALDRKTPAEDRQRDEQWQAWLLTMQRELEQGKAEIPS